MDTSPEPLKTLAQGRYICRTLLHAGRNSKIYGGQDRTLGRPVAVKELPGQTPGHVPSEALILAKIGHHPNILVFFDVQRDESRTWHIITEWLKASSNLGWRSLQNELDNHVEPFPIDWVIEVGWQAVQAVSFSHSRGIIHQDIKPANLMIYHRLLEPLQVKLIDFGSAMEQGSQRRGSRTAVTPRYASPEQLRNDVVTFTSDQYSLGVVLYELMAGDVPNPAGRASSRPSGREATPALSLTRLNPLVPTQLASVLNRCLQFDPGQRYGDTSQLLDEYETLRYERHRLAAGGWRQRLNQVLFSRK